MDPVRSYGDALALVTVTRTAAAPRGLVASLPAATGRPVQVLHVDTGGAPPVPGATPVRIREDVGRTAAVNRAVAALDQGVGWVVLADPQLEWAAGALDELLAAAVRYPRAAALGPRLRTASGADRASAGPLPTLGDALRGRVVAGPVPAGPVGALGTTCVLLRRVAWDSVDGFDARYPGCGVDPEPADLDLCDRLGRVGWLCVGVPTAEVTVPAGDAPCILEPRDRGIRRYVHDRHGAPARILMALARRN